jgi:hypothetical protein
MTWYTWLEQGRQIKPSRQVLDAVARTLRLTVAEYSYVMSLAGYSAHRSAGDTILQATPARVQRLLDALGEFPAFVKAPDWGILGWTDPFAAMYPNVTIVPEADRNLLWLVFTDPYLEKLISDYDYASRQLIAQFRAEVGHRLDEPCFSRLIERLLESSAVFRAGWARHAVGQFSSRECLFHHPVVGNLYLGLHRLAFSDYPDLSLVVYTPTTTTDTPARLRQMVNREPSRGPCLPPTRT